MNVIKPPKKPDQVIVCGNCKRRLRLSRYANELIAARQLVHTVCPGCQAMIKLDPDLIRIV
jgi:hypothetical protein